MSIGLVMPSNHLVLYHPFLLPSIFPSIRVFSNELVLHIWWPKYWNFSESPSSEYSGLISCVYFPSHNSLKWASCCLSCSVAPSKPISLSASSWELISSCFAFISKAWKDPSLWFPSHSFLWSEENKILGYERNWEDVQGHILLWWTELNLKHWA